MTTAADDDGQYRPWFRWVRRRTRPLAPALMWLGHYSLWLFIPYFALITATDAAGRPGWLSWVTLPALIAFWGSIIIDNTYHSARLCERCMGATPLDPEAAVERWRPALKAEHRSRLILALLLANIAWSFGIGNLVVNGGLGLHRHHDVWAYLLQDIPSLIIIAGYWLIVRVHRDLYPWCPWCHWDDGGDEEKVPDPDPEDHGVKTPH